MGLEDQAGLWCRPAQLDALSHGVAARVVVDHDARLLYANPRGLDLLGLDATVLGRTLIELVVPEDLAELLGHLASASTGTWDLALRVRLPSGERRALSVTRAVRTGDVWTLDIDFSGAITAEDLLLDMATALLESTVDLEVTMRAGLARFGEAFGVDRSSVFVFGPGGTAASGRAFMWSKEGVGHPSLDPVLWVDYLGRGSHGVPGTVRIDDTTAPDIPPTFARSGVRAAMSVQLALGGGLQVSVGMSMRDHPRSWTDRDLRSIRAAAAIFGNAIRRAEDEATLRAQQRVLEASEARLRSTIDAAPAVIFRLDADARILLANHEAVRLGTTAMEDLLGLRLVDFLEDDLGKTLVAQLEHLFRTGEPIQSVIRLVTPNDGAIWLDCRGVPELGSSGEVRSMLLFAVDITARRAMEDQIRHAASIDSLTGLANRKSALERIEKLLAGGSEDSSIAVLFVDLDRFKLTNDSLGHAVGDVVLQGVARALRAETTESDIVARLGGDEFAVVLPGLTDVVEVVRRVERIRRAIAVPVDVGNQTVVTTASIGVALASQHDRHAVDLIRHADVAMYQAKMQGRNRFEIFDENLRSEVSERIETEAALRLAVPGNQLTVHYQPEVLLIGGRLVGVEALVRWEHPTRGLLAPGKFIGLAEESGLIADIGRFVLTEACRQVGEWARTFPDAPLTLRVNVSGRQLVQPVLLRDVTIALAEAGLDPAQLCLEITETALMTDIDASIRMLRSIRDLGVRLAIDDFGTGYSSLGYLERFPVHALKIDRSFVAGLGVDDKSGAIVRTLMSLAHVLDLDVVAEGVETEGQASMLRRLGCTRAQGFLFSPGLPAADLEPFLRTGVVPAADDHARP